MPKEEIYNTSINSAAGGINMDCDPSLQDKDTTRFVLNAVDETSDGQQRRKTTEMSNFVCSSFPSGFMPIGDEYTEDDTSVVILTNPSTSKDEIGVIQKNNKYSTIVHTGVLGLKITNQCDIIYRLRKGRERVIYWVDELHRIRTFNLDRPQNFYNNTYKTYLKVGGNPLAFVGEKWDGSSFNLVKTYSKIPTFGIEEVVETGNILPGSYNFAIQLVDEDLNPTAWITTSNTINIYNDTTIGAYGRIRGSRNVQTDAQNFPRTNKSIKIQIGNLDQNFPFYRMAIIRAAGNTGKPEKTLVSELFSTYNSNFIYTGNDSELIETSLESIIIENQIIFAPKHIEQLENRLIVANGKGKGVNWCDLQTYASRISSDVVYQQVVLNSIDSEPNVKNSNSTWRAKGYMPGEVASFGIVYLFDDFTLSPVFHVPGKSNDGGETSTMKVYELGSNYLDIHNCSVDDYWGEDHLGNGLVGQPIRHHRFPFRHEVGKPLVAQSGLVPTTITKYRIKVTITLNPAFTPSPSYPDDGGMPPVPLLINYTFIYQVHGAGSTSSFSGVLTNSLNIITIYDDTTDVDIVTTDYAELDPTSDLATYQDGVNDRFVITSARESYSVSSSFADDVAEIFGIEFSNIQQPRSDIIGFYIVRNERLDDDKLIIDNAIFGPMTTFEQYVSFGLIMPKQYYHANNCGREADSGKTVTYYDKGVWVFNPEFEYFGKKLEYNSVEVEGTYTETSINMPTISNVDGSTCNNSGATNGCSRGVYIDDVQAGTSYDPSINKKKNKDDDGFDLIIGYRNTNIEFSLDDGTTTLPDKSKSIYLNAASYLGIDPSIFYNVSVDNKISMYLSNDTLDTTLFTHAGGDGKNALLYGSLVKNNTTAYSNFMNRPYYKEHNNPVMFTSSTIDDFEIFNGDAEISAFNFVSSVFYNMVLANRSKKSGLWKIILGGILVIAGVLLAIPSIGSSLGLTAAGVSVLSALAISYGVSLAVSGIKFEQYKAMIETDYELGLRDTVTDGGVFETIREGLDSNDDTIRWFADRVSNIYIESSVPFGLRSGLTSGVTDFVDAPAPYDEPGFRSYLTEKLTVLDRTQGSGRLYKGYAGAEFYDMNLDYMRHNHEKNFIHLPLTYDCCADVQELFPLRRWFSQQSFQEELIDNYGVFLPNNYSDMEGEHGEITDLYKLGNNLFCHTKEALWQQPANLQERVTDEIITFIGTGEFLSIPPRKVLDDDLGSPGTKHKWATIKTSNGVMFVDEIEHKIWLHGEKVQDVSLLGLRDYFQENLISNISNQVFDKLGVDFALDNNPANPNGIGYISTFDKRYNRVIITKRDYALLPDKLQLLNRFNSQTDEAITIGVFFYAIEDFEGGYRGLFYIRTDIGFDQILFTNTDYFENRSWTISFSFNNEKFPWTSWHSYLPNYYIRSQNSLYSYITGNDSIFKHNLEGSFLQFYGVNYDYIVEVVQLTDILLDKTTEDVTIQTNARIWSPIDKQYIDERYITFNRIIAYNSRQNSGLHNVVVKDTQAAPENWYQQQIVNIAGEILATRKGRNWNINDLRDYVIDYTKPMFTKPASSDYFIDKIVNPTVIDFNKSWSELESFRDKYIVIRLIFDNFNNVSLTLNYTVITVQVSEK